MSSKDTESKEWALLAYYDKDPLKILKEEKTDVDIITIQSGTDDGCKSYYVDAHIKCDESKKIKEWLEKAGKYEIQELSKIIKISKDRKISKKRLLIPTKEISVGVKRMKKN